MITRLNGSGAVTYEWLIGHEDPESVSKVYISRYKLKSDLHSYVKTAYEYLPEGGEKRDFGPDLSEMRRFCKRHFPQAQIIETWHSAATSSVEANFSPTQAVLKAMGYGGDE